MAVDESGTAVITVGSLPVAQRLILRIPLDINAMDEADFVRVPGIGPVLAKRIVTYRQINGGFMAVQDLLAIEGIGPKKYFHLAGYFN
jgi:competence protein ComEA